MFDKTIFERVHSTIVSRSGIWSYFTYRIMIFSSGTGHIYAIGRSNGLQQPTLVTPLLPLVRKEEALYLRDRFIQEEKEFGNPLPIWDEEKVTSILVTFREGQGQGREV